MAIVETCQRAIHVEMPTAAVRNKVASTREAPPESRRSVRFFGWIVLSSSSISCSDGRFVPDQDLRQLYNLISVNKMFESLTIRRLNEASGLDFGLLAESLLFYEHVNLIVNSTQLTSLIRVCGCDTLRELFDMKALSVTYLENGAGVRTFNTGTANEAHDFVTFEVERLHLQECLPKLLEELIGARGKARRLCERFKRSISVHHYPQSLNQEVLLDVENTSYISEAIPRIIQYFAPEYQLPNPFVFDVRREGPTLRVRTNLDFPSLNKLYHRQVAPEHSSMSVRCPRNLYQS
jgi:hypothetical protein